MRETWIIVPIIICVLTCLAEILKTDSKRKEVFQVHGTPEIGINIGYHASENEIINSTDFHSLSTQTCRPLAIIRLNFTVINTGNLELDTINHLDFKHVKVGFKSVESARLEVLKSGFPMNSIVIEVYEKTDVSNIPKILRIFESMSVTDIHDGSFVAYRIRFLKEAIRENGSLREKSTELTTSLTTPNTLAIIMCIYDQFRVEKYLPKIIKTLYQTPIPSIQLNLCVNNPFLIYFVRDLQKEMFNTKIRLDFEVFNNDFGYARFEIAEKLIKSENVVDYAVFLDDDELFDEGYLLKLWREREPYTFTGWYGRRFQKRKDGRNMNYWDVKSVLPKFKQVELMKQKNGEWSVDIFHSLDILVENRKSFGFRSPSQDPPCGRLPHVYAN